MELQYVPVLMLLTAAPMVLYTLDKSSIVALAVINVLIVTASLYYMFGPAEGDHAHAV